MFSRYNLYLCRDDGTTLPLTPSGGAFKATGAVATATAERKDGCVIFSFGAKLRRGGFDPDCGMRVELPIANAPYLANAMKGQFWCESVFGSDFSKVPPRTQALLWREGATWRLLWSFCGMHDTCTIEGTEGGLCAKIYSYAKGEKEIQKAPYLLYTSGREPRAMLQRAARTAAKVLEGRVTVREEKSFPQLFEYLGWCSWDALQIRVNEAGLLEKCREFEEKHIPVRWCIIDDMWGHVKGFDNIPADAPHRDMVKAMHKSSLYALEADPVRFPHGLAGCITALHEHGLKVGVWYPTTGYWYGIDPEGPLAKTHAAMLVTLPDGRVVPKPTPAGACAFHKAMQDMLKSAGADFVKVDNQSHYRNVYYGYCPVGEAAAAVQGAIEQVTKSHFGEGLINCMGMANESMWHRAGSAVSRCSDDFLPENRAWFAKHILQCAYNSLFQGQFHYSDWDMWWTDDEQAEKNSICRAISGGPVYVSDKIGRSRPEILQKLCFSSGRLLRTDAQAVPTTDCLLQDPRHAKTPLKIFNYAGNCGVLAAFNISEENVPQEGSLSAQDLAMYPGRYLVVEQVTGQNFILERNESHSFTLENNDSYRLFLLVPLRAHALAVGLLDKWISPKAIKEQMPGGVRLYEGGRLALYGVRAIRTNLRSCVKGRAMGHLYVYDLSKKETQVAYLTQNKMAEHTEE